MGENKKGVEDDFFFAVFGKFGLPPQPRRRLNFFAGKSNEALLKMVQDCIIYDTVYIGSAYLTVYEAKQAKTREKNYEP